MVLVDGQPVGSVEAGDARLLAAQVGGLVLDATTLTIPATGGDASPALRDMARTLADAARLGPWRNEELPVRTDGGTVVGRIERAAVRALGLRTLAVHLLGWAGPRGMWVQRRAEHKAVDPGLLDTLAGGLAGFAPGAGAPAEAPLAAMHREAAEEAGVADTVRFAPLAGAPRRIARPVTGGYMVEDMVVFEADLGAGFHPVSQDGEASGFECLGIDALLERIDRDEFTLEASLAILDRLHRAGPAGCAATGG